MGFFDDEEYQKRLRESKMKNAALLGEWVTVLFWLQIVSVIVGLIDSDIFDGLPVLQLIGSLVNYGIMIANSVILIKLKVVEDWFGKAGICYLVSGLSGLVIALFILGGSPTLASLLTIAMMIVQMRGNYSECTGYEVVLQGVDNDLAEKWALQWKLEIICTVTILVSAVVLLVSALTGGGALAILAGFVTLITSIGAIVLGIMRLIYLYRTADVFRNYKPREVEVAAEQDTF